MKNLIFLAKTHNIPSSAVNKVSLISEFSIVAKLEVLKNANPLMPASVHCMDLTCCWPPCTIWSFNAIKGNINLRAFHPGQKLEFKA
jgi:hypothetical protein